jgi:hypothetical protein
MITVLATLSATAVLLLGGWAIGDPHAFRSFGTRRRRH